MASTFHRDYLMRLPLPLAQLYSRAHNDKSSRSRHDCGYYALEALMKLSVSSLVAAYVEERRAGRAAAPRIDATIAALRRPSEGQWLGMLREAAHEFGLRVDAAVHPLGHVWRQLSAVQKSPEIVELYRRLKRGFVESEGVAKREVNVASCTLLELFDALVMYRNAVIGHGGAPKFEEFYEQEMGPLLFPAVDRVLAPDLFDPLGPAGSRLLILHALTKSDDGFDAQLSNITGIVPEQERPRRVPASEAAAWRKGDLFVAWPGARRGCCGWLPCSSGRRRSQRRARALPQRQQG